MTGFASDPGGGLFASQRGGVFMPPWATQNNGDVMVTKSPTLAQHFASSANSDGSITLDPKITFTRASSRITTDANGRIGYLSANVAAAPFDPATLASKGLLIEEARTNLLTYSEQFDNAAWSKINVSVSANATTAPDGTSTADSLLADATAAGHYTQQSSITLDGSSSYTFSVYLKKGAIDRAELLLDVGDTLYVQGYDLTTGSLITRITGGVSTATGGFIQDVGDGWFRCGLTQTSDNTSGGARIILREGDSLTSMSEGEGIYIWGAQLEEGSFPTSYIPTTTAAVTRSADVYTSATTTRSADSAVMTGTNFTDWYNQSEGTLVVSCDSAVTPSAFNNNAILDISGDIDNRITMLFRTQSHLYVETGNVAQANIDAGTLSVNTNHTIAISYKADDFNAVIDGGTVVNESSGTVPTTSSAIIGNRSDSNQPLNGHIKSLTYYPARLTDAQLQALTS